MIARRRDSLLACGLVLAAAAVLAVVLAHPAEGQDDQRARGQELFETGCASCHGSDGRGVTTPDGDLRGPSLEHAGVEVATYYWHFVDVVWIGLFTVLFVMR